MKKKGFTLIELLAVIVILAIIALIVTPVVSNIIESARSAANARSVEGHIKNIEYAIIDKAFNTGVNIEYLDGTISTDGTIADRNTKFGFNFPSGDNISCTKYLIETGTISSATGCSDTTKNWNNTYSYTKENGASTGNIDIPDAPMGVRNNSYSIGDIIYYNVDTGYECSSGSAVSTAGTKAGCMKFYVIKESTNSDTTVTMMLDHATRGAIQSYNVHNNSAYGPLLLMEALKEDTDSWVGTITPSTDYVYTYNNGEEDMTYTLLYHTDGCKARLLTKVDADAIIGYDWAKQEHNWTSDAYPNIKTNMYFINIETGTVSSGWIQTARVFYPVIEVNKIGN